MVLQSQTLGLIKSHHQRLAGMTEGLKRLQASLIQGVRKDRWRIIIDHLKKIIYLHLQNSRTKINQFQKLARTGRS